MSNLNIRFKGETAEVIPVYLDDGREFIPAEWIEENSWLKSFVDRFPEYWKRDPVFDGYTSIKMPRSPGSYFVRVKTVECPAQSVTFQDRGI